MKTLKYFKIIIGGLIVFVLVIFLAKIATEGYSVNWYGFSILFIGGGLMLYSGISQKKDPHSFKIKDYKQDDFNRENESLEHLDLLNKSGLVSDDEYLSKKQSIEVKIANTIIEESTEYKSLKHLLDKNLISQEEFENKKEELLKRLL
ncbi:SHOCT domain-containing protein [Psychroserpens sp. AS72]|uniref:SHOCT domain-containing protein n=1 Tax=Psychroserpens sp. AS72 TaxID=3135775 RepID=UPI00316C17C3